MQAPEYCINMKMSECYYEIEMENYYWKAKYISCLKVLFSPTLIVDLRHESNHVSFINLILDTMNIYYLH